MTRDRHTWVAGAALALVGCSLLGNFETSRCDTDKDCAGYGLASAVCVANNCVAPTSTVDAGDAGTSDAPALACEDNVKCTAAANGKSSACVTDKGCVPVLDTSCPILVGQDKFDSDPRTILFGAYVYLSPVAPASTPAYATIDLAVRQINAAGGLPTAEGPRFVSVLVCTKQTPALVTSGAKHMLGDLRIPLVYGQLETDEVKGVLEQARAADSLYLSAYANDATIKAVNDRGINDSDLLWFSVDDIRNTAAAFGPVLALAEQRARAISSDPDIAAGTKNVRIAMVTTKSAETLALKAALTNDAAPILKFNAGQDHTTAANFKTYEVDSLYRVPTAQTSINQVASQITSSFPEIVIGLTGDELTSGLIPAIEAGWGGSTRPVYIAGPFSRFAAPAIYDAMLKSNDAPTVAAPEKLQRRFVGVDFSGDRTHLEAFESSFTSDSRFSGINPKEGFNTLYDTTFLAAAAAQATLSKNKPLRGSNLSDGMKQVTSGEVVDISTISLAGRVSFPEGLGKVRQGDSIVILGTTGKLELSKTNGDRTMGASVFCVDDLGSRKFKLRFYASQYDANAKALDVTPSCFAP